MRRALSGHERKDVSAVELNCHPSLRTVSGTLTETTLTTATQDSTAVAIVPGRQRVTVAAGHQEALRGRRRTNIPLVKEIKYKATRKA